MTSPKKKYLKIPPELVDGYSWSIMDADEDGCVAIGQMIWSWLEGSGPEVGDELKIELIEMTDEEVEALPEL